MSGYNSPAPADAHGARTKCARCAGNACILVDKFTTTAYRKRVVRSHGHLLKIHNGKRWEMQVRKEHRADDLPTWIQNLRNTITSLLGEIMIHCVSELNTCACFFFCCFGLSWLSSMSTSKFLRWVALVVSAVSHSAREPPKRQLVLRQLAETFTARRAQTTRPPKARRPRQRAKETRRKRDRSSSAFPTTRTRHNAYVTKRAYCFKLTFCQPGGAFFNILQSVQVRRNKRIIIMSKYCMYYLIRMNKNSFLGEN